MFALDERLGAIVTAAREPAIGMIRLAWWRESLERLDTQPAPAEPLLAALAKEVVPRGVYGKTLAELEHGWAALIDGEPDDAAIARFGRCRGGTLFAIAARLLGADDGRLLHSGEGWALADLAHRHSVPTVAAQARDQARCALSSRPAGGWPRAARPLAALAALAALDASAARRRQGSPSRVARMLAMRLFGR